MLAFCAVIVSAVSFTSTTWRRRNKVSTPFTQLRLARALFQLPDADDLTTLALDVGFSSHSHFTLAFRRAFGCTPSQFRSRARSRKNVLPLRRTLAIDRQALGAAATR
jgi:AraC-like DNA-binding protein